MIKVIQDPEPEGDVASRCDDCDAPIFYGERAWMINTGEEFEGKPVVKIVCDDCHDRRP